MVLEQLKNSVPGRVVTYIGEHNVIMPEEVAVLADNFVLMHKTVYTDWRAREMVTVPVKSSSKGSHVFTGMFDPNKICN